MLARQQFILTPVITLHAHTPKQNKEYNSQDTHIRIICSLIHTTQRSIPISGKIKVKKINKQIK